MGGKIARTCLAVGFLLTLATSGYPSAPSQDAITIPDEVSCEECSIVIEHFTTLRPAEGDGFFCSQSVVTAAVGDTFYAIDPRCSDPIVLVFDRKGSRTATIGGQGQGPGELSRVRGIWTQPDGTLYVAEPRRLNVFSAAGEFVRSTVFPRVPSGFAVMPDGSMVIAAHITTQQRVGFPLHTVSADGTLLRSFGGNNTTFSEADAPMHSRILAAARSPGSIWSARIRAYEIEEWQPETAARVRRIERDAPWFDEAIQEYSGLNGARLRALREDDEGLLWTIVNLQTVDYESDTTSGGDINENFDTIIEVLDPRSGQLVATSRHDLFFFVWAGDFTFSVREDEDLNIIVDVWLVSLQGRQD